MKERKQFLRIANAILKKRYKFKPQREAWSAKMYVAYLKRKNKEL